MAELGVGIRVRTGWDIDDEVASDVTFNPRIAAGVIVDGPMIVDYSGRKFWKVRFDHGDWCNVAEHLLFPIDDGDPVTTEESEIAEA